MRLLFTSYWYYPEPVQKPHDLASALVERGHQVSVLTGFPNYPQGKLYPGYRIRLRQREVIDGVNVVRVPAVIDRSKSGLRRIISYMSFSLTATCVGRAAIRRPDVIWNYQVGLPGIGLGKLYGVPVVHEVQDLWPEWSQTTDMGVGGLMYRMLDVEERYVYRQAVAITTISRGFQQVLVSKGVPEDKISVLPNWANERVYQSVPQDANRADREGMTGKFNVIYGGNIGTAQGLGVVLLAADALRDRHDIQFLIIGDGVERDTLEKQAAQLALPNVRFLGRRPPEEMASYLALADALFLHLKRNPAYAITIPSKTYAYLATGRPIIAAAEGEVADLVLEIGAGIACPPEDPDALARAVLDLYGRTRSDRTEMGQRAREASLTRFGRQAIVDEYEELFRAVVTSAT